jgi:hypothetical protein
MTQESALHHKKPNVILSWNLLFGTVPVYPRFDFIPIEDTVPL